MTHANTARRGRTGGWRFLAPVGAFLVLLVLLGPAPPALAADGDPGDEASPWRVARLRVTEGSVQLLPDGGEEWDEAEGNVPLSEGDRVNVPDGAAAVLSFRGHEATLHDGTDLSVVYLRDERAAYRLSDGRATFRLSDYDFVPVRVSLPSGGRVRMVEPGTYRISVSDDEAVVRVARGEAVVSDAEGGKVRVRTGQQAFVGDGVRVARYDEPPPPEAAPPPLSDEERAVAAPPAVVYELRDYGDWVVVGDYGYVWRPRVAVGWSPFVYGGWNWSVSFGWSWISYEPWGWYPYHCGRWYQDRRYGWVWVPRGAFAPVPPPYPGYAPRTTWYRPVAYYPATARVVREGGNVRWLPLAPRERFVRPVLRREDTAAYRYVRPLPPDTVYGRDWGRGGGRTAESWRGLAPTPVRTVPPPRDSRPVWRLGDEKAPYRGDRVVAPAPGASPRGAEGRPMRRVRERERREPEAAPAPGRRGPDRVVPPLPERRRGGEKGAAPAPPPSRSAPPAPAPAPPGRGMREGRPVTAPAAPAAAPPAAAAPAGRALKDVRPVAPPPPRERSEGRPASPPPPSRGEGRPDGDEGRGGGRFR